MVDMEQDLEPPILRPSMQEVNEYLQTQDYTQFSPQAVMMMYALVRQYNPSVRPEDQAQYCQMQFSILSDGGGTGSVRHRRMITHTGDRIIGHNLIDHHTQVRADDRIRQSDLAGFPLPFANLDEFMAKERRKREAENAANAQAPAQNVTVSEQVQKQTAAVVSVTTDQVVVATVPSENTTTGDVAEEVVPVMAQKTRRVRKRSAVPQGQSEQAQDNLAAEQLTIEVSAAAVDTSEIVVVESGTLTTGEAASEITPVLAPTAAAGVEGQLIGAIVRPTQLDQTAGQATTTKNEDEDLEALLLAVTADIGTDVANEPQAVENQDIVELQEPVSMGSNAQQSADLTEVFDVSDVSDEDNSDDDQPIVTFGSASTGTKRGRAVFTGSSTSIAEPPAARKRLSSTSSTGRSKSDLPIGTFRRRSRSLERRSVHKRLVPLRDGTSQSRARGCRSASGSMRQRQTTEMDEDEELFRLIHETLLEMSQDINTSGVSQLPYPRNAQISAECLLDEDDTFFAGRPPGKL